MRVRVLRDGLEIVLRSETAMETYSKQQIAEMIEAGWQSAQEGRLVEGETVFERLDAELAALEQAEAAQSKQNTTRT